jgi:tRNA(Ile)-lysidine synthase
MSKFESSQTIDQVVHYLTHYGIRPSLGSLVLGTSGGVDSMVLLRVLHQLDFNLTVVHVNYHQRGDASDLDQQLVERYCQQLGVPTKVYHWSQELPKGNFQDAARTFRQQIFRKVCEEHQAQAIALGHNKGDRIETIMMRLLRGSAPSHWDGLKVYDPPIIRPLIDLDRSHIQDYAQQNSVPWRDDQSNKEDKYARNILRNEVFPRFETHFPGWEQNLERLAQYGKSYEQAIDLLIPSDPQNRISLEQLRAYPNELQMAILHRFLERNGLRPSTGQIHQVQLLIDAQPGRELTIDDQKVIRESLDLVIHNHPTATSGFAAKPTDQIIPISNILESGYEDDVLIIRPVSDELTAQRLAYTLPIPHHDFVLRPWQKADRIAFKDGSKLISDLLNEWKIPSHQKSKAQVLTLEGKIIACIFRSNDLKPMARLAPRPNIEQYPCLELYLKL